jgi:formylmethanofuran dehydrogenase subunit B
VTEIGPLTCAGCGLLCDDVTIEASGDGVRVDPSCELGSRWFSERAGRAADGSALSALPAATVGGQPADVDAALARVAELLRTARRPLVHGFAGATVEDARAAVALADRIGALVAVGDLGGAWPGAPAASLRGASTATLGEIRDRSQLLVIWREDPERTHPRLLSRLGFGGDPHSPPRAGRTLVVVDDRDTATARRADVQLRWPAERDLEALSALHVLQRNLPLEAHDDVALELEGLLELLVGMPHAAFVHGAGLSAGAGGQRRLLALHELVRALSHDRHVVTLELPRDPGTRGAADALAWQTGYAPIVDLAAGHPEMVTTTVPLVAGEEVDLSLRIEGASGEIPGGVTQITFGSLPVTNAEVSIRTAPAGVAAAGTMHRLDGVPLTLQAPHPGEAPTAAELLARLLARVGS